MNFLSGLEVGKGRSKWKTMTAASKIDKFLSIKTRSILVINFNIFFLIFVMMSSPFLRYNIGDYVDVTPEHRVGRRDSEGGIGFIVGISPTEIDVEYVISINSGLYLSRISSPTTVDCRVYGSAP